jgi:hypothetical protein
MSQRYRKSLAAIVTSEPEISSGYATRNKRRKLDETVFLQTIPRRTESIVRPQPPSIPQGTVEAVESRHFPMYGRNLNEALKSILSESPKRRDARGGGEVSAESRDVTPSADEETSPSAAAVVQANGHTSSISMSSHSRETTPTSSLGGQIDIAPFIEYFQKEREGGRVSKEVREEALKILREWRSEWYAEDKRIRELKRKIKTYKTSHVDVSPTNAVEVKSRSRSSISRAALNEDEKSIETPKPSASAEPETPETSEPHHSTTSRRESVAGPNGLTGAYWDISLSEMGRGNRRKSRT